MIIDRKILLNPGPATTTDTVKQAQIVADICPRESEFGNLMQYIADSLVRFISSSGRYSCVLFGGSGTCAVESVLSSVISPGEQILVVNNGAYGKRMVSICDVYSLDYVEYNSPLLERIDLDSLEKRIVEISKLGNLKYIACVHSETTTGLLNDIEAIGKLALKYDLIFIVDAMSSFGAVPIDMDKMNVSFLVSSANKNLQGMPGVSFVIADKEELTNRRPKKSRTLYLDLYDQYDYFVKYSQMRFTPPVQVLYAMKQAVDELKEETPDKRYERYTENWETLKAGLDRLGFQRLINDEDHSHIITSVLEPNIKGFSFDKMHDWLYEKGITIYPGKINDLNTFRIANIGAIDKNDIKRFLNELENYLNSLMR